MPVLDRIDGWDVPDAAVGVTDASGTIDRHGPTGTVQRLASVTKPLVAYAVLVAVDQGRLDLDDPAGPESATVRHLLAHAAGYPMTGTEPLSPVGKRRVYSNTGYEVLGSVLEERTGRSAAGWLRQQVLLPLGMHDTALEGSPAADAVGTVDDLLLFARELLEPSLMEPELAAEARQVQFPGLDGVLPGFGRQTPNDWGLGLEIRGAKEPHWTGADHPPTTIGHFGQSGSFLWVAPELGLAAAFLGGRDFGDWAREVWPGFNDALLHAYADA